MNPPPYTEQNTLERRLAIELQSKFQELLNQELALAIAQVTIDFLSKEKE